MNTGTPNPHYVTCRCSHCDGGIEFDANELAEENSLVLCPHCSVETKLYAIPSAAPLGFVSTVRLPRIHIPLAEGAPAKGLQSRGNGVSHLGRLTAETIRKKTKAGDTPLHRAAKNGQFHELPMQLLNVELFMVKNTAGETPLHVAAKHGHLSKVPPKFLTKETLTICTSPHYAPDGIYSTGSGYMARTETALHIAALRGYANQIPQEFLTPEFFSIPATGYRMTLLHYLAKNKRLDLVPEIYSGSEMWNAKNHDGQTPREALESQIRQEAYFAAVRGQPATEKQKVKLLWFGCTWDDGITKGQASDAIDECIRRFPKKEFEYYNRPATAEQLAKLRPRKKPLTYGEAKDLIWERKLENRVRSERKFEKTMDRLEKRLRRDRWY